MKLKFINRANKWAENKRIEIVAEEENEYRWERNSKWEAMSWRGLYGIGVV